LKNVGNQTWFPLTTKKIAKEVNATVSFFKISHFVFFRKKKMSYRFGTTWGLL